jgi:hypothetical protein
VDTGKTAPDTADIGAVLPVAAHTDPNGTAPAKTAADGRAKPAGTGAAVRPA